jgi:hypothetical protein
MFLSVNIATFCIFRLIFRTEYRASPWSPIIFYRWTLNLQDSPSHFPTPRSTTRERSWSCQIEAWSSPCPPPPHFRIVRPPCRNQILTESACTYVSVYSVLCRMSSGMWYTKCLYVIFTVMHGILICSIYCNARPNPDAKNVVSTAIHIMWFQQWCTYVRVHHVASIVMYVMWFLLWRT